MKITKKNLVLISLCGWLAPLPAAWADDAESRPQVSVGLKVWNSSWFSYLPGTYAGVTAQGGASIADSVDAIEGARKTTTLPGIAVRSGNYLVSASYAQYASDFYAPHSAVIIPSGQNVLTSRTDHLTRKEGDLAAGYFVTPNIALTVGYKHATESRDTSLGITGNASTRSLDATVKGVVFGTLVNFPIQGNLRFYGLGGYGPARVQTIVPGNAAASISISGRYLISEIGLNYSLMVTDVFVKGASAGLGYRSQTVKTDGVGPGFLDQRAYRDVKDGLTFSLNVTL